MKPKKLIRPIVSILALAIILRVVDFAALKTTLLGISPGYAALIVLIYFLGQILSSIKWWLIANAGGVKAPFTKTLRAYFTGMFVNIAGVGTIGGDVARGILIATGDNNEMISTRFVGVTTVIADRLHGLAVLAGIGLVGVLMFGSQSLEPWLIWVLAACSAGVVLGWIFGPRLVLAFFPRENRFRSRVEQLSNAFPRDLKVVAICTGISIFFHLSQIVLHKFMGYAIGVDVPWALLFVACPFSNILSTLPISFQGLGVRENAYRFFFVTAGALSTEQAVAFGALWFCAMTISGSIGGLVAIASGDFQVIRSSSAPRTVAC